jgi:hypothetical protein
MQGAADGGAAELEPVGHEALGDAGPRGKLSPDDAPPQLEVGAGDVARPRVLVRDRG